MSDKVDRIKKAVELIDEARDAYHNGHLGDLETRQSIAFEKLLDAIGWIIDEIQFEIEPKIKPKPKLSKRDREFIRNNRGLQI